VVDVASARVRVSTPERRSITRTIRARITFSAVIVMAVTTAVGAVVLIVLLQRSLLRDVDNRAKLRMQDVATLAARGQLPVSLAGSDEDGTIAQVVAGGRVVAESPVLSGSVPMAEFVPPDGSVVVRTVRRTPIPGGARYRVAARLVDTPSGGAVVYVAAAIEPVTDSIGALTLLLAFVVPLLVALVAALTWWLAGRTLEPVEAIRRQVAEIGAAELSRRVPEPGSGDEVDLLARTMNTMLDRLEAAVLLQRSFVSDAAHELRSPLATMRTELDVASVHPVPTEMPALVARLAVQARRLERLVEDLLVLSTSDERGVQHRSEVDVDELVLEQLAPLRASGRLAVDVSGLNAGRVWGDRGQLERVVANLLDNAEHYAATTVRVELCSPDGDGGWVELVVADDGPGVPAADRERVFGRFSRVDQARGRAQGGSGLGLAIVRRIVEDHGGTIAFAPAPAGARVVVRLPVRAR
jgi:signal transduction histidine kinase